MDYGTAITEVPNRLAARALVFMIISMPGHCKHPIANELQDKCTASFQSKIIKKCIGILYG